MFTLYMFLFITFLFKLVFDRELYIEAVQRLVLESILVKINCYFPVYFDLD